MVWIWNQQIILLIAEDWLGEDDNSMKSLNLMNPIHAHVHSNVIKPVEECTAGPMSDKAIF